MKIGTITLKITLQGIDLVKEYMFNLIHNQMDTKLCDVLFNVMLSINI